VKFNHRHSAGIACCAAYADHLHAIIAFRATGNGNEVKNWKKSSRKHGWIGNAIFSTTACAIITN